MYWILFIGIALLSYLVQSNLKKRLTGILKCQLRQE